MFCGSAATFDLPIPRGKGLKNMLPFKIDKPRRSLRFEFGAVGNQKPLIDAQNFLVGENDRPFNDIFQFPNVARPSIPDQSL